MLLNYKSEGALEGKRISVITAKAVLRILFLIQIFIFYSSGSSPAICRLSLLTHLKMLPAENLHKNSLRR